MRVDCRVNRDIVKLRQVFAGQPGRFGGQGARTRHKSPESRSIDTDGPGIIADIDTFAALKKKMKGGSGNFTGIHGSPDPDGAGRRLGFEIVGRRLGDGTAHNPKNPLLDTGRHRAGIFVRIPLVIG